jgi:hypothetical protein
MGLEGHFCNYGINPLFPPLHPKPTCSTAFLLYFFFLFLTLTLTHISLLSPPSSFLLPSSFFLLLTDTHTRKRERPRQRENVREREREREGELLLSGGEERKNGFLENSVQSASTAPINKHSWSDRAEILQGDSRHVNLHCERWRSDLEQSAFTSSP